MLREFTYRGETARGQYSGQVHFATRKEACEFAEGWSRLDGGRREMTIMEWDEGGFEIVWSATFVGGERQH